MTNQDESRLSMYISLRDWQTNYTAITSPLPNYTENSTSFVNTIPLIQNVAKQQKISKTGLAENKNQLKDALIISIADYSGKLGAYAKFTNNQVLAKEIKFTAGKLKKEADTAVRDFAQIVYDRAQPIVADLATYGITAATQTALLDSITAYNASIGKPAAGKVETSQLTKQLGALFATAEAALENMDAAVEIVKLSQPNFYNGYKNARKVVVTGTGSLSVKGLITDAETGEPVKGVTVSFALDGGTQMMAKAGKASSPATVLTKKTAKKGGLQVKSLPEGTYQVTLKKAGYADQIVTVSVNDGEMTVLNVEIAKI